jgi:hypothetical protein
MLSGDSFSSISSSCAKMFAEKVNIEQNINMFIKKRKCRKEALLVNFMKLNIILLIIINRAI